MSAATTRVVIGHPSHEATPGVSLFPDPEAVIENWSAEMAARVVPVIAIDRQLLDPSTQGRAVVVVWDDPGFSFLSMEPGEDGRMQLPDLSELQPLDEPFDRHAMRARWGMGLTLERLHLPIAPPEQIPDWDWQSRFGRALAAATGARNAMDLIRFDTYPCLMQDPGYRDDAYPVLCEISREALGIGAGTFYASSSFIEMQMT
jgi:hypothetical protein